MDNARQRQSIKDCLVCPLIANIQNPIYKTRLYTPYIYSYVLNAAVFKETSGT